MKCLVTGAGGFVGANLAHYLAENGHEVLALVRSNSDLRGLEGAKVTRVTGDITQKDALRNALRGCDWCFHVAASYHLWLKDYRPMYAANVDGTRNVIEAAAEAGCQRIIYTSTVGCIGLPKQDGGVISPTDESTPVNSAQMKNHYKLSKWQAEEVARELAAKGLPVVIVNPSAPIGPRDVKPTPTGQVILDFLNDQMPAYMDTGLNWVHVRDVAAGNVLAAEKGRIGERYILGNAEGNMTMRENSRSPTLSRSPPHIATKRFPTLRANRPKRPSRACAWPNTKCFSAPAKPSGNLASRKRPCARLSATPSPGFAPTAMSKSNAQLH
jgi:dihydroflavonol-4-reductase